MKNDKPKFKIDTKRLARLVTKAQKGNEKALESIVSEVSRYIYGYCLVLLRDSEKAQDAVQDILLSMIQKLHTLKNPECFLSWLKTMTANYCKNKLSRERESFSLDDGYGLIIDETEQVNPSKKVEIDDLRKTVVDAVNELPPSQRESVMMYYYEQLSIREIAEILSINESTVKSRLRYAKSSIRRYLEKYGKNNFVFGISPMAFISYALISEAESFPRKAVADGALRREMFITSIKSSSCFRIPVKAAAVACAAVISFSGLSVTVASGVQNATRDDCRWKSLASEEIAKPEINKVISGSDDKADLRESNYSLSSESLSYNPSESNDSEQFGNKATETQAGEITFDESEPSTLTEEPTESDRETETQTEPTESETETETESETDDTEVSSTEPTESEPSGRFDWSGRIITDDFVFAPLKSGNELSVYEYIGSSPNVSIPETYENYKVVRISNGAFREKPVRTVVIPDTITRIDAYAFCDCRYLESITMPDSVRDMYNGVFKGCVKLKDVKLSGGIACLEDGMFTGCEELEEIVIPEGVTEIGTKAFSSCGSLQYISLPDGLETIGNYAFDSCSSLEDVQLPESLTKIGDYAFLNCSALMETEIPDKTEKLGIGAFCGCCSLRTADLPHGLTTIPKKLFEDCGALMNIKLPNTLQDIGYLAFKNCSKLKSISLGKSIGTINYYAFSGCDFDVIEGYCDTPAIYCADLADSFVSLGYAKNNRTEYTDKYIMSDDFITALRETVGETMNYKTMSKYISREYIQDSSLLEVFKTDCGKPVFHIVGWDPYTKPYMFTETYKSFTFGTWTPFFENSKTVTNYNYFVYEPSDKKIYALPEAYELGIVNLDELAEWIPGITKNGSYNETVATEPEKLSPMLNKAQIALSAGESFKLKVTGEKAMSYISSDETKAVIKNGIITALAAGRTTITAKLSDGSHLTARVEVTSNPKLSKKTISVKKGKKKTVEIIGKAAGVNNSYKNTKYAKVISSKTAKKIKVQGLKRGESTLKITVNGKVLKLRVKVV